MPDNEDIEELVERKVEERLEEERKEMEKEVEKQVREKITEQLSILGQKDYGEQDVSRRQFLKKLGAGAIGLGALSLSPVSANWINLGDKTGEVSFEGNNIQNVTMIDGINGNHRIRFDSNNSWLEFTDQSNTRSDIVVNDIYLDNTSTGWLSGIENSSNNSIDADTVDGQHASDLGAERRGHFWPTGFASLISSETSMAGGTTSNSVVTASTPLGDFSGPVRAKMYVKANTRTYNGSQTAGAGGEVQIIDGNGVVASIDTRANTTTVNTQGTVTVSASVSTGQSLEARLHATLIETVGAKTPVNGSLNMSATISVPD